MPQLAGSHKGDRVHPNVSDSRHIPQTQTYALQQRNAPRPHLTIGQHTQKSPDRQGSGSSLRIL